MYVHGAGHFHPETEITNRFLEELGIGTDDEWIIERVGIRSRRTVLPLDYLRETRNRDPRAAFEAARYTSAELASRAARLAIERAGIAPAQIGLVLGGGSIPDTASPAEACNLARILEIECPAFDVSSACTSFLAQLQVLSWARREALPDFVLLAVAESGTKGVDYSDRASAVLWGDAAAAVVVSPHIPARARIEGSCFGSSPAGADRIVMPRAGHFRQDGRAVQMFAIRKTAELYERLREVYAQEHRSMHFVGHQANLRMLEAVCRECRIPPERHHCNVEWFGNTAAAGAPSVLSQRWDDWKPGDDVALIGVGSGLSWSSAVVRFGAMT